jgi:hypothetical protein
MYTVTQIINGNHHNRALQVHQVKLQAHFDPWLCAFLDDHPAVYDLLRSAAQELTEVCTTNHDVRTAYRNLP